MEYLGLILENTSLWEIIALVLVIYVMFRPSLLKNITRVKIGDLEIELKQLKEKVAEGQEQINELEAELESERRLFEDILENFDPNAPMKDLAAARQALKANAKSLDDIDALNNYLSTESTPEDLYAAAVTLRERRPPALLPNLVTLLGELAVDQDLCGYRLNTVWTLTSALHLTLLSAIRDGIPPPPSQALLVQAEQVLDRLERNPRVQNDRPDNPLKGVRGPIKHCRTWVEKGLAKIGPK